MNVGLDIGGTKCAISTGECRDGSIEIKSREEFPTAGLSWRQVLEEFARRIALLGEAIHERGLAHVGAATTATMGLDMAFLLDVHTS